MKQAHSRQLNRLRSVDSLRKNGHSFDPSAFNEASFSYYQRLERVRHFVEQNYAERISLADAAQVARMKPTAFSDFFRRKTGICFRDWLAAVRVNEAMELMSTNNLSVKELALEVGYRNLRSFQRVFLRFTGQSPIEYKHSVRPS
jgi:two-component system response regulator YesN